MRTIFSTATLALGFVSLPSVLAGPACSRRLKNQSDCVAECAAKWGWPGAVMGTDRWGSVMAPSQSKSVSEAIASACGDVESSAGGIAAGASSSSSSSSPSPTFSFVTLAASSSTSGCSGPTTTATVTSISTFTKTVTPGSCPVVSSGSSSSSSSSTRTTTSTSTTTSTTSTSSTRSTTTVTSTSTLSTTTPSSSSTSTRSTTTVTSTATSTSSASSSTSTSTSTATTGTSGADISSYLQYHNTVRAQHGASPLSWNDTLANAAQSWASKCVFQHSGGSLGPYGENLAAGTGSGYGIQQAVQSWTNEASQYDPNNPQPSHFTQVVWKATTQLGCAVASCNGIFPASYGPAKYYVCEYFVQGNVIGKFPQNVQ